MAQKVRWVPLEANPEVLNKFAAKLGLDTSKISFIDVYGLDEELLAFVPQPVYALILLFPVSDKIDAEDKKVDDALREKNHSYDPDLFYMKQTISNACGTMGVLHAVGNNQAISNICRDSFFDQFFSATKQMSKDERGEYLEKPPEGAPNISKAHAEAAQEGQTRPPEDMDVTPHFITLVNHKGRLYELDGRKEFPVDHGQSSDDTLLQDAAKVARQYMTRIDSVYFNLIALTKTQEDV